MRWKGKLKLGWFPLALAEAARIRKFLVFPATSFAGLDPCIGEGSAFAAITASATGYRYGIELDAYRAEQARSATDETIQGDCFDVHCPVESFSLISLNPPYDHAISERESRRTEPMFLEHCYRWLKPGGVLVLVIPGGRLGECGNLLARHFREVRVYRLTEVKSARYKQVVLFGVRRSRRERERLQDSDIGRARLHYASMARSAGELPALPNEADHQYAVPEMGPVRLVYRGMPLDQVEDLLEKSGAYRQAGRILFAEPTSVLGRPLTHLKPGHVGLLAVGGMLNGIFGSGNQRHISCWQAVKVVDKTTEEDEQGVITVREKERFSNELTLVFATGQVATLK